MATSGASFDDGYLAGIIDGEGCVSVSLNKALYTIVSVRVAMLDHEPVDALYLRFGGIRSTTEQRRYSRPCHVWGVHDKAAIPALRFVVENCKIKQKVAEPILRIVMLAQASDRTAGHLPQADREERVRLMRLARSLNNSGQSKPLNEERVAAYLSPKTNGRVAVLSSDGKSYASMSDAAAALGLSASAVSFAIRNGTKCHGLSWSLAQ